MPSVQYKLKTLGEIKYMLDMKPRETHNGRQTSACWISSVHIHHPTQKDPRPQQAHFDYGTFMFFFLCRLCLIQLMRTLRQ